MPRNKYPEQTVEKILDAATILFLQKGYQHTTLQDIIEETHLSKGAVYHHFKSKEEIAFRVGDRLGAKMLPIFANIRDDSSLTGGEKLKKIFSASLEPKRQHEMMTILPYLSTDSYFMDMEQKDLLEKIVPSYVTPIIRQGVQDGSIKTSAPEALGEAIFLLADTWLHPLIRKTTAKEQTMRNQVFQQLTANIGVELLDKEQAALLVQMAEHAQSKE